MHVWNFRRLFTEVINVNGCDRQLKEWLVSRRLIPKTRTCECGQEMELKRQEEFPSYFLCSRADLHTDGKINVVPQFRGTIFELHIPPECILIQMMCFSQQFSRPQAVAEASYKYKLSHLTAAFYRRIFAEAVSEAMLSVGDPRNNEPIGGKAIVVEICEMIFARPVSSRSRITEGMFALGMIQYGSKYFRIAVCPEGRQDTESLFDVIRTCVLPGTTIVTDRYSDFYKLDTAGLYDLTNDFILSRSWKKFREDSSNANIIPACEACYFCTCMHFRTCAFESRSSFDELVYILGIVYPGN